MIVTPVANEPSALRSSRELKPSAEVLCTVALWLPVISPEIMSFGTLTSSICRFWRLERGIGRQAQCDAPIHGAVDVPIQHIMCVGRVHVAERALQRVPRINRAAAGRREENIDRLGAQRRGKRAVAAITGALAQVGHAALAHRARRLVAIA